MLLNSVQHLCSVRVSEAGAFWLYWWSKPLHSGSDCARQNLYEQIATCLNSDGRKPTDRLWVQPGEFYGCKYGRRRSAATYRRSEPAKVLRRNWLNDRYVKWGGRRLNWFVGLRNDGWYFSNWGTNRNDIRFWWTSVYCILRRWTLLRSPISRQPPKSECWRYPSV